MSKSYSVLGRKPPPSVPPAHSRKGVVVIHFSGNEEDGEISSLEEGEEVTELRTDRYGWTTVRTASGRKGKAPTCYVNWTSKDKGFEQKKKKCFKYHLRQKTPPKPPKSGRRLRALHQYCADGEDEIDLDRDDEVLELVPDDGGWTTVRKEDGEEGLVPTSYLGQN